MFIFCAIFVRKTYSITAAQAAQQQQILQRIEDVLSQKFDEAHYSTWLEEIKKLVEQYKNITIPTVKKEIKVLQNILSWAQTSESTEEKIRKINEMKNDEIDIIEKEKSKQATILPEEENKILSDLDELLKEDISEVDEANVNETVEYKKWKYSVQQHTKENQGKSKKIDEKIMQLNKKLNIVEITRNVNIAIDQIKTELNKYSYNLLLPNHDNAYKEWKKKTQAALSLFDENQKLAHQYNITISQETYDLAQQLLDQFNKAEGLKKNPMSE